MQNKMLRGFTLIELLVVVLIIGILASVALPQYQKAVMKSRFATIKNLVKSISDAQEVYYLANGAYATTFDELSIDIPAPQDTANSTDAKYVYDWGWCEIEPSLTYCHHTPINMEYQIYFSYIDNSYKGKTQCVAGGGSSLTTPQSQICRSESGLSSPTYTNANWSVWNY